MQPPAQQASPPTTNMYHPPQQAMMGGGLFSLHKFLMIGHSYPHCWINQRSTDFSLPAAIDYDSTKDDYLTKLAEDTESYSDFVRLMDTFATIIGILVLVSLATPLFSLR